MSTEIRQQFESELLDKGVELKSNCPRCNGCICSFPDIKLRPYKGKRTKVYIWECWNCKVEFIQVFLPK